MSKGTVLVVDDSPLIRQVVADAFQPMGYTVFLAADGSEALRKIAESNPDLIVADILMPVMDGWRLCEEVRRTPAFSHIPFIFLTTEQEAQKRVRGLRLGADDYVTKPFSPRELAARLKAVLRRTSPQQPPPEFLRRGGLTIDLARHEVACDGEPVTLTATEFRLLQFLAGRPGRVYSRSEIIDGVLGREVAVLDRTVDVHIMSLRRKLGGCGDWIETVRGFGYKFLEEEEQ